MSQGRRSRRAMRSKEEVRLAVNMPAKLHRSLKRHAAEQGVSIRKVVLELLARAGIA